MDEPRSNGDGRAEDESQPQAESGPSSRAKFSILAIGALFLSMIACMCIAIFAIAAVY